VHVPAGHSFTFILGRSEGDPVVVSGCEMAAILQDCSNGEFVLLVNAELAGMS